MTDRPETTNMDAIRWPDHKAGLHITHNLHLGYYETIEQAIGGKDSNATYLREDFPDAAEIALAIETGSVWEIQWYPDTPVGFCRVCAATLGRALQEACK